MWCQVCSSDNHQTENCPLIGRTKINDSPLPQRAFLTLPTELEIRRQDGIVNVVPTLQLTKGTQFGPFQCPKNKRFNSNCAYMLPILHLSKVLHYLDTTNLDKCNWMTLVQFTTNEELRNTICYQLKNEIFFSVVETVKPGQSLIVGYSSGYMSLMEQSGIQNTKHSSKQSDEEGTIKQESIRTAATELDEDSDTTYDHDYIVPTSLNDINNEVQIADTATPSKDMTATRTSKRLRLKRSQRNDENDVKNSLSVQETGDDTFSKGEADSDVFEADLENELTAPLKRRKISRRNVYPLRNVEVWKCKFCLETVDTLVSFAQHLTSHYKNFKPTKGDVTDVSKNTESSSCDQTIQTMAFPYTCDICTAKPYNRLESLISHLRIAHLSRTENADGRTHPMPDFAVQCRTCRQYFANDNYYKSHVCTPPIISCTICQMVFDNRTDLKYHSAEHTDKDFTCSRCSKILTNTSFAIHISACETVRVLAENSESHCGCCWIGCQEKDLSVHNFFNHLAEHTHPFQCSNCSIRIRNPKQLNAHSCQQFECDGCTENLLFDSILELKNHITQSHPESLGIQCLECTLPFATREGYQKHGNCEHVRQLKHSAGIQIGANENAVRFVCEVCGAQYSNLSSLKTHRSIHSEKKFVCLICSKGFSRKALLIDHSYVHGDAKFTCSVCGKRMKTLKSLGVHKLIHSELKPFNCDICGKGFAQKINLQSHLRSHLPPEEKKQEICDQCGNAFSSREYLKLHLETHQVGHKFACDICNAQFIRPHFLHQHKKTAHGNDAYKCEFCPSGNQPHFRHKYSLQRHLIREHSESKELWEVEGYLKSMLVTEDGPRSHPKTKKTSKMNHNEESAPISSGNADNQDCITELTSVADTDSERQAVESIPFPKPRLSTKLSKLLKKEQEQQQLMFEVCHEMPEDLEIENEVVVGEDDDSSRTELTLTLDDETSELYSKSFADHGNLKDENMVLLQVDDSGRYVIAFSHDLNLK